MRKRKNAVPKVDDFSAILQQEGLIIRELREQYKCNQHDASCFVDDGRHIKLTAMHFQCWTKEIVIFLLIFFIIISTHNNYKKNYRISRAIVPPMYSTPLEKFHRIV